MYKRNFLSKIYEKYSRQFASFYIPPDLSSRVVREITLDTHMHVVYGKGFATDRRAIIYYYMTGGANEIA